MRRFAGRVSASINALLILVMGGVAWWLWAPIKRPGTTKTDLPAASNPAPAPSQRLIALAKNVYYEAALAREPLEGLQLAGYVPARRAVANDPYWGGAEIYNVIYACHRTKGKRKKRPNSSKGRLICQFSWVHEQGRSDSPPEFDQKNKKLAQWQRTQWELSLKVARAQLDGTYVPPPAFKDVTSYLNTEVTRKRWPGNYCDFVTKLVFVGKIHPDSLHDAYRKPANDAEREALPKRADVPECNRRKKKKKGA